MAYTEEEKKFWYQEFTLKGRILHPNLIEAKPNSSGRVQFNTMFAWPDTENQAELAKINAFVTQAKAKYHAQIPDMYFSYPIKHFNTYVKTNGQPNAEYLRGHHWLNASSGIDMKPRVVNQQLQDVMNAAEVYSGRNAVIRITFWNNTGGKDGTGKKGISCNVKAVLLLPGGEEVRGAAEVDIAAVFGGFAADMNQSFAPQAPAQQYAPQAQQAPTQQYAQQPAQYTPPVAQPAQYTPPMAPPAAPQWPPINPQTGRPYNS